MEEKLENRAIKIRQRISHEPMLLGKSAFDVSPDITARLRQILSRRGILSHFPQRDVEGPIFRFDARTHREPFAVVGDPNRKLPVAVKQPARSKKFDIDF